MILPSRNPFDIGSLSLTYSTTILAFRSSIAGFSGARLYYLYSICLNWDDDDDASREILSQLAESMDLNSRRVIDDSVLKDVRGSVENAEMDKSQTCKIP